MSGRRRIGETKTSGCNEAVLVRHALDDSRPPRHDGPAVRGVLKGNTQAALSEQAGHPARWFTAGCSDRYKNDQPAIDAAVQYVADQEGMLADMQVFIPRLTSGGACPRREEAPAA